VFLLVPTYPGSPGPTDERLCVSVSVSVCLCVCVGGGALNNP